MNKVEIICETGISVPWRNLRDYQGELKELSTVNFEKLKKVITDDGFAAPIFIWKDKNYILDGHQRIRVIETMIDNGFTDPVKLPCVNIRCRDKKHAKKLILDFASVYGKATDEGFYQFLHEADLIGDYQDLIDTIDIPDIDMEQFAIGYLEDENEGLTDDDAIPEEVEARCKSGDLWKLGENRLLCGDATVEVDVERLMDGKRADMVFTDPPYNIASESINYASDVSKSMNKLKESAWDKDFDIMPFLEILPQITNTNSSVYVFTSHFLFGEISQFMRRAFDFSSYCIWNKPNPMPSLSKRHWTWNTEICVYATNKKHTFNFPAEGHILSVWTVNKKSDGSHPTQKPLELCQIPIKASSKKLDIIADFFGGSGSTLIACEKLNRKCYMMELDPVYCSVILQRWEEFTGKEAKLSARHPAL